MDPDKKKLLQLKRWQLHAKKHREKKSKEIAELLNLNPESIIFTDYETTNHVRYCYINTLKKYVPQEMPNRSAAIELVENSLSRVDQPAYLLTNEYTCHGAIHIDFQLGLKNLSTLLDYEHESLALVTQNFGSGLYIFIQEHHLDFFPRIVMVWHE